MPIAKLLGLLVQFALFPTPLIDAQLALATPAELSDPAAIAPDAAAPNIKPPVSRNLCCGTALCLPMGLPSRNDRPDVWPDDRLFFLMRRRPPSGFKTPTIRRRII